MMEKEKNIRHFYSYLERAIRENWESPALTDYGGETSYTYGEMSRKMAYLQALLERAGIRAGDRVAICSRNCANWAVASLAIFFNRSVMVSLMDAFVAEDIEKLTRHSGARVMFVSINVWERIDTERLPDVVMVLDTEKFGLLYARTEEVRNAYSCASRDFAERYGEGFCADSIRFPMDNMDELMMINYTSGTTSEPKGVMLSYRNISANIQYSQDTIPNHAGWSEICMLPLAHMFGFTIEFLYQVAGGCHVYFLCKKPSPSVLMKAYVEVKPYMILTVPLVLEKIFRGKVFPVLEKPFVKFLWNTPVLCKIVERRIYKSLMKAFGGQLLWLITGGAAINAEVERVFRRISFPFVVGYGMTETGPLACYAHPWEEVVGCCGKVVDRCEFIIDSLDPEHIAGEVLFRGAHVMMGYYNNEAATHAAIDDNGWLHTGDLGVTDKKGRLFLKGRMKALILSSDGQNIYPEEIEDRLNSLPLVVESLVVKYQERLVALVYADKNAQPDSEKIRQQMDENLRVLNAQLPRYEQVHSIRLMEKEFEKTPKQSIRRFLYQ